MNRAELKEKAKEQLKGKIGILFVIMLIIGAISFVSSLVLFFIPFGGLVASIVITPAFTLSTVSIYLNLTRGIEPRIEDSFKGFEDFWSAFKVTFLVGLFTWLWSLLFVIPGIIKSIEYSQSMYILAENKKKPALECINESRVLTNGHKMDLFVLSLSFIGWCFVGSLTLGIGFIWITPYMQATFANAYRYLKGDSGIRIEPAFREPAYASPVRPTTPTYSAPVRPATPAYSAPERSEPTVRLKSTMRTHSEDVVVEKSDKFTPAGDL